MSIILDALNKLEDSQDKIDLIPSSEPDKPKGKKKNSLLYLFLIVLGLVTARTIFIIVPKYLSLRPEAADIHRDFQKSQTAKVSSATKADNISIESVKQTINTLVRQAPRPLKMAINNKGHNKDLILNGIVFSSGDDSYALVNNKIVKNGDIIDGFNVVAIKENEVELRSEDLSVIKLSFKAK